ncbi:MAG: zinc-ribbon domain-containing protein [Promethearchaeota archaeon]|nr:MAG: zinc-ribbon domain-containing protein [Candidatus Lokiarchaeota archaeon]
MILQFPDLCNIFGPFFIFFIIILIGILIVFIIIIVYVFKFFFGGSKEEMVSSESNPYRAKPKTSKMANDSENKYAKKPEPTICQYCGSKVEKNQKICSQCGASLD